MNRFVFDLMFFLHLSFFTTHHIHDTYDHTITSHTTYTSLHHIHHYTAPPHITLTTHHPLHSLLGI
eukprot:m.128704 g.128704  ORF g.128704 m.128704 type:complete len:66 (+) comp29351_c1_seq7:64-261(+)